MEIYRIKRCNILLISEIEIPLENADESEGKYVKYMSVGMATETLKLTHYWGVDSLPRA